MISLDGCNRSYNTHVEKIYAPNKTKTFNIKVFNMITYYPFMIILDGCIGTCPILFTISRQDVNVKVFNMVTELNKAKTEVQHVSCDFKCKFDGKNVIQLKNGVLISVNMRAKN